MRYREVKVIAGKGPGPGQFAEALNGIGIDRAGLIYAVGDAQVKVFDTEGKLQRHWPTDRPGYCVAVNGEGTVFVGQAGQVEIFDPAGRRAALWRDVDRLRMVTAVDFFGEHVFVADAAGRCIRRYDREGTWLNDIGKGPKARGFLVPNGYLDLSVDAEGIIHAPNPGRHRVERYTTAGELVGHFGRFGGRRPEDFPGCCNPTNLALTSQDLTVVTEKAPPRLKVYDADGKLLTFVGPEAFDANCKNMDVATDSLGRIYVIDTVRLTIHVFAPDKMKGPGDEAAEPSGTRGAENRE